MLEIIVSIILFAIAFCMVAYEWAIYLLVVMAVVTVITWLVSVYCEHVLVDVKAYRTVYNLFYMLRMLTVALAVVLGLIWIVTSVIWG